MHAEIISIGDELTGGRLLDTNSQWLSLRLEELGIPVLYHTTVGDELPAIIGVVQAAAARSDVIISTGGLGPTADDLTRQALAEAAGKRLLLDDASLARLRCFFERIGREMPEHNTIQAYFPEGSRIIPNAHGTAPGIDIALPREGRPDARWFALPGVPAEMRDMWAADLEGAIREFGGGRSVIRHRVLKCFGAGESRVEAMLPDLIRRGRDPRVGITASEASILLRITASGANPDACEAAMEPTIATIRRCLGSLVFSEGDEELQDVVLRLLHEQGKTLATIEWGTAGLVAELLGGAKAPHHGYLGGMVVSDLASARRMLQLDEAGLASDDPIAATTAMAVACRERLGADWGLAVGPFPGDDAPADAVLTFPCAVCDGQRTLHVAGPWPVHPAVRRIFAAKTAINAIRLGLPDSQ